MKFSKVNRRKSIFCKLQKRVSILFNKEKGIFHAQRTFVITVRCKLHTFMSADLFHHCIEQSIRKRGSFNRFLDFANKANGDALAMTSAAFSLNSQVFSQVVTPLENLS